MRKGLRHVAATLSLAVASSGCDGSTGASALCDIPVAMSATTGAVPQFSWDPACLVETVHVYESRAPSVGGPRLIWSIERVSGMAPPVRYGQAPPGAQVTLPPEVLVSGRQYRVELGMNALVGNSSIVGELGFTH
jgi:hypothetical protein